MIAYLNASSVIIVRTMPINDNTTPMIESTSRLVLSASLGEDWSTRELISYNSEKFMIQTQSCNLRVHTYLMRLTIVLLNILILRPRVLCL